MKKSILYNLRIIIILFLIICLSLSAISEPGPFGDGKTKSLPDPVKGQSTTFNTDTQATGDGVTANVKSGETVTGLENGYQFSKVEAVENDKQDTITKAKTVKTYRDGSMSASEAKHAEISSAMSLEPTILHEVTNLESDGNGGMSFDSAQFFQFDAWTMANAKGVTVEGSLIKAESSDDANIYNTKLETNTGIEMLPTQVTMDSSEIIITNNGRTVINNVKDVLIKFDETNSLEELSATTIVDNNEIKINSKVKAIISNNSRITIKQDSVEIESGELVFTHDDYVEKVTTSKGAKITLDFSNKNGFYALKLSDGSSYSIAFNNNPSKNFEVIPQTTDYTVYIKKVGEQSFDFSNIGNEWTFIDFTSKMIKLNSLVEFNKGVNLINSEDDENQFDLMFDDDFVNFDLKLENDDVIEDPGTIYIGNYEINEELRGSKIHTIVNFIHEDVTTYIKSYEHKFNEEFFDAKIMYQDGKLIQKSDKNEIILFTSGLAEPNLKQEFNDYKNNVCDQYNSYYDNNFLPNYVDTLFNDNRITGNIVNLAGYDYEQSHYYFIILGILLFSVLAFYSLRLKKKSQVTMFIIIGIVIVFVFAILYVTVSEAFMNGKVTTNNAEISSLQLHMQDCLTRVTMCSLEHQGMNYGQTKLINKDYDIDIFKSHTKEYLDKVSMKCYDDVPNELKQGIAVTFFDSYIVYDQNTIIDFETDMTLIKDASENGIYDYKINPPVKVKALVDFATEISEIDLTHLGESGYNINVYEINNEPLYVVTDAGSKIFNKDFKIIR